MGLEETITAALQIYGLSLLDDWGGHEGCNVTPKMYERRARSYRVLIRQMIWTVSSWSITDAVPVH
jgi:hypothetical protein